MPARELLDLAERWRRDPAGAAQDGHLLATTRAALASLDGRERAALGTQLRRRGAEDLAGRLETSDRLPVWSEEFTAVARELLTLEDATLDDLREAVPRPERRPEPSSPRGAPQDLPPPSPDTASAADLPPPEPVAWDPPPGDATPTPPRGATPTPPSEAAPSSSPDSPESAPTAPAGPEPATGPVTDPTDVPLPGGTTRSGAIEASPPYEPPAPGVRSEVTARTRFAALTDDLVDGIDAHAARRAIAEAPDGWQRRRVILRLLQAGVEQLDADEVLRALARPTDRVAVADRLVRHGVADLDAVSDHLPAAAAARLRRRHA